MTFDVTNKTAKLFDFGPPSGLPEALNPNVYWHVDYNSDYFGPGNDLLIMVHDKSGYVIAKSFTDLEARSLSLEEMLLLTLSTETSDILPVSNKLHIYSILLDKVYIYYSAKSDREIQRVKRSLEREIKKEFSTSKRGVNTNKINDKLAKINKKINTKVRGQKPSKQELYVESINSLDRELKEKHGPLLKSLDRNIIEFDYYMHYFPKIEDDGEDEDYVSVFISQQDKSKEQKFLRLQEKVLKYLDRRQVSPLEAVQNKKFENLIRQMNSYLSFIPTELSDKAGKWTDYSKETDKEKIYEFNLFLDYSDTTAKYTFRVPANSTFEQLDFWISHMLNWSGYPYHLSSFLFPKSAPDENSTIQNPDIIELVLERSLEELPEKENEQPDDFSFMFLLNPFYQTKKQKLTDYKLKDMFPKYPVAYYRYDYGDNWYAALELSAIYDIDDPVYKGPQLIKADKAVPPEDIGGPFESSLPIVESLEDLEDIYHDIYQYYLELEPLVDKAFAKRVYIFDQLEFPVNLDEFPSE